MQSKASLFLGKWETTLSGRTSSANIEEALKLACVGALPETQLTNRGRLITASDAGFALIVTRLDLWLVSGKSTTRGSSKAAYVNSLCLFAAKECGEKLRFSPATLYGRIGF